MLPSLVTLGNQPNQAWRTKLHPHSSMYLAMNPFEQETLEGFQIQADFLVSNAVFPNSGLLQLSFRQLY